MSDRGRDPKGSKPLVALVLLAALSGSIAAKELPGKWVVVSSVGFRVVSNASEKTALETLKHLEKIRHAFGTALPTSTSGVTHQITVYAPKDERSMKRLVPGAWRQRRRMRPAGAFFQAPGSDWVVLRADIVSQGGLELVYHEYFHYLARRARWRLPRWLSEGLADFWGGARVTDEVVEVGRPLAYRLRQSMEGALIPLDEFFAESSWPETHNRAGRFYAQSWLITHYLIVGSPEAKRRGQLRRYLSLYEEGVESLAAARQAFGNLRTLHKEVSRYRRSPVLHFLKVPIEEAQKIAPTARKLSDAEAAAEVSRLLIDTDELAEARPLVEVAVEGAPGYPLSHESAGLLALKEGDRETARPALERAVKLNPDSPVVLYALAVLDFRPGAPPANPTLVEERLTTAIGLRPLFAAARLRLAELHRLNGDSAHALELVREARLLRPDRRRLDVKEVRLLKEVGMEEEAAALIQTSVQVTVGRAIPQEANSLCWYGALEGLAAEVLPACESAHEAMPESAAIADSLALAYAQVGNLKAAEEKFRQAAAQSSGPEAEEFSGQRGAWADSLAEGENPFAGLTGIELLAEVGEDALDWGY